MSRASLMSLSCESQLRLAFGIVGQDAAALDAEKIVEPLDDVRSRGGRQAQPVDFLRVLRIAAGGHDPDAPFAVDADLVGGRNGNRALRPLDGVAVAGGEQPARRNLQVAAARIGFFAIFGLHDEQRVAGHRDVKVAAGGEHRTGAHVGADHFLRRHGTGIDAAALQPERLRLRHVAAKAGRLGIGKIVGDRRLPPRIAVRLV